MRLTVSGLDTSTKFKYLWGRYPYGFKPSKHCLKCFVSRVATRITPAMSDGVVELKDQLFYLCAVGQDRSEKRHPGLSRGFTNVHIAARPAKGSVIEVGSVYGVTFRIDDAERIPIEAIPDDFRGLARGHARCKNFQFGHQMFDDESEIETSDGAVFTLRDRWKDVPLASSASVSQVRQAHRARTTADSLRE